MFTVLYSDENLLVIDKPSGVVVHPFDHSEEITVLDELEKNFPECFLFENKKILQDGRVINLGGLTHKLDRDTSGVLVITKNKHSYDELTSLFTSHKIKKTYVALLEGVVQEEKITIDAPLGRNKKEYKNVAYPKNPRGELLPALTELTVIKRNTNTTLVTLSPQTGRTHQLRAHMAHIGHPIVGDVAYGATKKDGRIMLHAYQISFSLNGSNYSFEAPTPEILYSN
jgi:23S rRNA pseudouridine1911/1915/1917 synthase